MAKPGTHATQDLQAANARLIAAAPDLLAACQSAIVRLEVGVKNRDGKNSHDLLECAAALRAAVARATGGT